MNEASIRPYREGDLEAVLDLRARVFEGLDLRRERRRWAWEFAESPFRDPATPATWVIELEGRIVGNYGLLPWRVAIDGRQAQAFCGIDFAVAPELQGRGLGHPIAERFMDSSLCAFPFITSPTPATSHLMAKFGGAVIEGAREPCLWVRAAAAAAPASPDGGGLRIEELERFDERFDELYERLAPLRRIQTVRSAAYLEWRYSRYPFGPPARFAALRPDGSLAGFAVLQLNPDLAQAYLTELFVDPSEQLAVGALLARGAAGARAAGLDLYLLCRDTALHPQLANAGFAEVAGHSLQFVCRTPEAGPGPADWYVSSGDGDLLFGVGGLPPEDRS